MAGFVTDIRFKRVLEEHKEYVIEEKMKRANARMVINEY